MTLESVNYIALFAGALLLMRGSGYRPHPWSYGKGEVRSEPGRKSRTASASRVDKGKSGSESPLFQSGLRAPPASYAAIIAPYGGRTYGGHYD
jgi:hypothetical protein